MKIKGVEYKIKYNKNNIVEGNDVCDGLTDIQNKWIEISTKTKDFDLARVVYHELTHAFLYESGLRLLAFDETLVDWLAMNLKEIKKCGDEIVKAIKEEMKR